MIKEIKKIICEINVKLIFKLEIKGGTNYW